MHDKYLNPFTDFGFKKLFGEEPQKHLLISFLNTLLPEHHQIKDLQYTQNEYQGASQPDRKAIFDLNCVSTTGERFIVELQKAKQNYFKDRSVYYATFPIQEQAKRGDWDFKLSAVYTIGILDFTFDDEDKQEVVHTVQLKNQRGNVFYDKLTFIYLTLPCFKKTLEQLETEQDRWFYVFRHLHELNTIPETLQTKTFIQLFEIAEIACLDKNERQAYINSLKYYRDLKNVTDTARDEGWEEGLEHGLERGLEQGLVQGLVQGRQEERERQQAIQQQLLDQERQQQQQKLITMAQQLLKQGLGLEAIAQVTGLSLDEIEELKQI